MKQVGLKEWRVFSYSPLEKLNAQVWRVEGSLPNMPLKRVMTLLRLKDGAIVIHNAIALNEEDMRAIEAWGEPRYLIVPNGFHRLDAAIFKQRYPQLKVLCPRGARALVSQAVQVDSDYSELTEGTLGGDQLRIFHLKGLAEKEGALLMKAEDGVTLVVNDAIFNQPHLPGFKGLILRLIGSTGEIKITRIARLFLVKNRAEFADQLRALADVPQLKRIIVSHGPVISDSPAECLKRLALQLVQ